MISPVVPGERTQLPTADPDAAAEPEQPGEAAGEETTTAPATDAATPSETPTERPREDGDAAVTAEDPAPQTRAYFITSEVVEDVVQDEASSAIESSAGKVALLSMALLHAWWYI